MTAMTTPPIPRPAASGWGTTAAPRRTLPTVCRERRGEYGAEGDDTGGNGRAADPHDTSGHGNGMPDTGASDNGPSDNGEEYAGCHDAGQGPDAAQASVRDAARDMTRAARRLVEVATAEGRPEGGELGALLDTLQALDVTQAAAVALTGQAQSRSTAERSAGLPLEQLLAMQSRLTGGDRRMLQSVAETLRTMPHLTRAFRDGWVGWAEVRAVVCEVRNLTVEDRATIDVGFAQISNLTGRDADRLVDEVRSAAAALRPGTEAKDTARAIENRFFALQPMLGGGGTGYFELDDEGFAIVAEGLEAAMPPPSAGPNDVTRDAVGHADDDASESETADGDPTFCDPVARRSRARQRADALIALAESFLAGGRADGSPRRARPRMLVTCQLTDLVGEATSRTARLLTQVVGAKPAVTREALRRLSSDADLQFIIEDQGQIVGVTAPTETIPARVRAAVHARDQGCRFPGCRMPVQFTDCHHVVAREDEGPTIVSNLVALCRRHHVAVTEGRWKLTMDEDGTVTVKRGRRRATSDPPRTTPFQHPARPSPPRAPFGGDPPG